MADFNPQKYRSLISHIGTIKENIEAERVSIVNHEQELMQKVKHLENYSKVIQKQLTQQIEVTNEGYANLAKDHHSSVQQVAKLEAEIEVIKREGPEKLRVAEQNFKNERAEFRAALAEKDVRYKELEVSQLNKLVELEVTIKQHEKTIENREWTLETKEKGIQHLIGELDEYKAKLEAETARKKYIHTLKCNIPYNVMQLRSLHVV